MCRKRKYDKIGAMFALAKTKHNANYNHNRKETRIYFCEKCNAYHLTSQKIFDDETKQETKGND